MGLIRAVVLDWAGTTVDLGSLAPVRTIQRVFERYDIRVSDEDARRDMGLPKKEHLRRLLSVVHPKAGVAELETIYAEFIPVQLVMLEQHSALISGVAEAVERMRGRDIHVGSTTGYTREMLDVVLARAARQGYVPDCSVTPEEAGGGRPHPYMMYLAAMRLQRYPLSAFVKVGDTPADIDEGRNAGTWTVGVCDTGNCDREALTKTGADFVIGSVADIDDVLNEVESRLAAGQSP